LTFAVLLQVVFESRLRYSSFCYLKSFNILFYKETINTIPSQYTESSTRVAISKQHLMLHTILQRPSNLTNIKAVEKLYEWQRSIIRSSTQYIIHEFVYTAKYNII